MLATIVHRGPDGEGRFDRPVLALGMRRLAIIDLAGGDQQIFNEDGSVAFVFNGEIYNFRELRGHAVVLCGRGATSCGGHSSTLPTLPGRLGRSRLVQSPAGPASHEPDAARAVYRLA